MYEDLILFVLDSSSPNCSCVRAEKFKVLTIGLLYSTLNYSNFFQAFCSALKG